MIARENDDFGEDSVTHSFHSILHFLYYPDRAHHVFVDLRGWKSLEGHLYYQLFEIIGTLLATHQRRSMLKGVAERAGANGTTFGGQEADSYSITQFCKITPYLTMNPALEFRNPSVYPKAGVTTIL